MSSDLAIVGAGAAGLMAGICAGRTAPSGMRIVAMDGAPSIGAKILVAGGGRCNVTHDIVHPHDYAGSSRNAIAKVLRSFSVEDTIRFFADLDVKLKREETGKLFPTTDRARTVLDALLRALREAGVELRTNCRVTEIACDPEASDGHRFTLTTSLGLIHARRIILATGGKSLPKTGSDGAGYAFAQTLGHTITPTTPALVPLVLPKGHWLTPLSGLALDVELQVAAGSGKILHRQRGAMLLTHFGLSGPAVMDISRHWLAARRDDPNVMLQANLLPPAPGNPGSPGSPGSPPAKAGSADGTSGGDFTSVEKMLLDEAQRQPRMAVGNLLRQWLPQRLADALVAQVPTRGGSEGGGLSSLGQLTREQRRALAHMLTALPLPVVCDRGYLFAEVTAGGVPLNEVELATMASRRCPGLHLCGEILDVDGRIGGYNFQWAWCTGRLAGLATGTQM